MTYDRHFAPGYYQLGALLEQRGDMNAAVKALRQAISTDATYPEPSCELSRIYRRQGQIAEADVAMDTYVKLRDEQRVHAEPPR